MKITLIHASCMLEVYLAKNNKTNEYFQMFPLPFFVEFELINWSFIKIVALHFIYLSIYINY